MPSPEIAKSASVGGRPTRFESCRKYAAAPGPPIDSCFAPSRGSASSVATRVRGMRQRRLVPSSTTGAETARRARRAAGTSISEVTFGAVTRTGSAVAACERSIFPRARTIVSAALSWSSRVPVCSSTVRMRRPRRTSAASTGFALTSAAIFSSANSSAPFETASCGKTSAPKTRVRSRRNPRIGPKPSLARLAAVMAELQSGWTASWLAANRYDSSPATNTTGLPATRSKRASSSAVASRFVMPPTSTPATWVPSASSCLEPA